MLKLSSFKIQLNYIKKKKKEKEYLKPWLSPDTRNDSKLLTVVD